MTDVEHNSPRLPLARRIVAGASGVLGWLGFGGAIAWALVWLLDYWHDGAYHHLAQVGVIVAIGGLGAWLAGTRALVREVRLGIRARSGDGEEKSHRGALAFLLAPLAGPIVGMVVALSGISATSHGATGINQPAMSAPAPAHATGAASNTERPRAERTYVVRRGDRIRELAEHFYGDAGDWVAIAKANMGRVEPGGAHFIDPSVLRAGWTLVIPELADATPSSSEPASTPANGASDSRDEVLYGALGGFGLLGAALLAARQLRRRRLQQLRSGAGRTVAPMSEADAVVEVELRGLAEIELPTWIDAANRLLFSELAVNRAIPPPKVAAMRAGPFGLELLLDPPSLATTPSFQALDGGHTWRLDPALELEELRRRAGEGTYAYLPVLVPFGEDDNGSHLVAVGAGESLGLSGTEEEVQRALGMVALHLQQAPWAEVEPYRLPTGRFPGAGELGELRPEKLSRLDPSERADPLWRDGLVEAQPVVLIDDPEIAPGLAGERRGNVALVAPLVSADRVLCYEGKWVTLEPLGLRVRACLPEFDELGTAERLVTNASAEATSKPEERSMLPAPTTPLPEHGSIEVRLLRPVPDLVGDLPDHVKPIAFRLIAYLAAHDNKATTNKLRDALGSYRQDESRASQTVWHAAAEARKAIGSDRIPLAINKEYYELSAEVTCDWVRFEKTVEIGRAAMLAHRQDEAIEIFTKALELVEGAPASGTKHFPWLEREQLTYAIERCVVEAAHWLFELVLAERSFARAEWAIDQGRLVSPDDGELRRDAMRLAHERGDDDALVAEHEAATAVLDEVEPSADVDDETDETFANFATRRSSAGSVRSR